MNKSTTGRTPSIRWAVVYGVVVTAARCLGEYGSIAVVSGAIEGKTETAALRVDGYYQNFDLTGAYAVALVLGLISIGILFAMSRVRPREGRV